MPAKKKTRTRAARKEPRKPVVEVKDLVEAVEMLRAALNTIEKLYLDGRRATQNVPQLELDEIERLVGDLELKIPPLVTAQKYCP